MSSTCVVVGEEQCVCKCKCADGELRCSGCGHRAYYTIGVGGEE